MFIETNQIAKSIKAQRSRPGGVHGDVGVALDALAEDLAAYFKGTATNTDFNEVEFLVNSGAI